LYIYIYAPPPPSLKEVHSPPPWRGHGLVTARKRRRRRRRRRRRESIISYSKKRCIRWQRGERDCLGSRCEEEEKEKDVRAAQPGGDRLLAKTHHHT
jgi:hypothetical protein